MFKFKKGDRVRVPFEARGWTTGRIEEGFCHDGHAMYVIETKVNRSRRLVVREEELKPAAKSGS